MNCRNYDILAVDLDGTLLGPDGRVSTKNRLAIERARKAGLEVVICTGRGLIESRSAIDAINAQIPAAGRNIAPIVTAGGALVCDAAAGRTLHRWPMNPQLVSRLCDVFAEHRRAPLLFKDRDAAGFDYLVVNSGPIEYPTRWWFSVMNVEVKFVDAVAHDPHPEHTVRVGFAATTEVMHSLAENVRIRFGREALVHHFAAVSGSVDSSPHGAKDDTIHLLEVFDPQVSKWTAVHRLALEQDIPRARIAAIGDEINDISLIEGAALGIAMGNAVDSVKRAANRETLSNAEDGVAHAIDQILSCAW